MKLHFELTIDAPIDVVWAAFDNPDNMRRWQQNFHSYTRISGANGEVDSVAELAYDENGKMVVLTETITERRQPDLLAGIYESVYGSTLIVNHFQAIDERTTRWKTWCNFNFRGFMKVMSLFVAGSIRRRTEGDMQRFKLMVETDQAGSGR